MRWIHAAAVIGTLLTSHAFAAEVRLSGPDTVEIGRLILVEWTGPGHAEDSLQVYEPATSSGEAKILRRRRLTRGNLENRRAKIVAPEKAGTYVLRYWSEASQSVLDETTIEVVDVEVSLAAPEQVDARHPIRVAWKGPAGRSDAIHLFDPSANDGAGNRMQEQRIRRWGSKDRVVVFRAPPEPGVYELRYWNGENDTVLATRPIEVVRGTLGITAPRSVERAGTIVIQWEGPGGRYDMVRLFDPDGDYGNHGELQIIREKPVRSGDFDEKRVELVGPAIPGEYELQYWDGQDRAVLASQPIEVEATEVTLDAPAEVVAGDPVAVRWVGPGATGDEVQIMDAQSSRVAGHPVDEGKPGARTVNITAPKAPGAYVLRYWSAANRIGLATKPIEVVAPANAGGQP